MKLAGLIMTVAGLIILLRYGSPLWKEPPDAAPRKGLRWAGAVLLVAGIALQVSSDYR